MYKKHFCGKLFAVKVELLHGIAAFRKEGWGTSQEQNSLAKHDKSLAPALDSDLSTLDDA